VDAWFDFRFRFYASSNLFGSYPVTDGTQTLEPGSMFGQHRILRLLGRGGMGEVYEVEHELTGKRHALKLLSSEVMEVPGALECFEREARVMARLEHPGIVRVDLSGEDSERRWLRMELMPGREVLGQRVVTLEEYVAAKGGRLPESETKALLVELLDALAHAHGKSLVHRDLKPANVLFSGDRVKIVDFGLVNAAGAEWMETQVRSTVINQNDDDTLIDGSGMGSRSRAIMGTYAYMSPEQRDGLPADARSDLYAVGLMVFRMLTGLKSPGMKRSSELGLSLDQGWDLWLIKTLEEEPSERYASAVEMQEALNFQLAVKPDPAPVPEAPKEKREPEPLPRHVPAHPADKPVRKQPVATPVVPAKGSRVWLYWVEDLVPIGRIVLRSLSLVILCFGVGLWWYHGAQRGLWKTSVENRLEIPIIEGMPELGNQEKIVWEDRFVSGIETPILSLVLALLLWGLSFLISSKNKLVNLNNDSKQ